jgi:phage-related protein
VSESSQNEPKVKPVIWVGDSLKQVKAFPVEVRQNIGVSLFDVQKGSTPDNAKPFKGVGSGIFEIVTRFDKDTYRTVYAVQIGERVYVLHAFQKKSPKGITTAQKDINLIKSRYKQAIELEQEAKS